MDEKFIIMMGIVLLSFGVQALSGFGSMIIAITLGSHFFLIESLLPVLVPLDLVLNGYLIARYHSSVEKRFLVIKILPFMGAGFIVGVIFFFNELHPPFMKIIFGIFVVVISSWELFLLMRGDKKRRLGSLTAAAYLALGGFIQGLFASGGPPVVYVVSRSIRDKLAIRSTLASLWFIVNSILTVTYVITGKITAETIGHSAFLLPSLLGGLLLGDRFHHAVNERHFRVFIFCLLIIAGLSILISMIVRP